MTRVTRLPGALGAGLLLAAACTTQEPADAIVALPPASVLLEDPELLGVKDVRRTEDGGLVVLSRYSPYLRWYDAGGQLVCVGGWSGDGPGEFRYPWAFVRHAPVPMVADPNHRRLTILETCAGRSRQVRLPDLAPEARRDLGDLTYGDPHQLAHGAGGLVAAGFPGSINHASGLLPVAVLELSLEGEVRDTILDYRVVPGRDALLQGARWLIPIPLWDTCPDGSVVAYDGVHPELTRWQSAGGARERIPLPGWLAVRRTLPDDEVRIHIRHWLILEAIEFRSDTSAIEAQVDEAIARIRPAFGRTAPTLTRLLCDDQQRVWLQEFALRDHPTGRSAGWTVLEGPRIRRVRFPDTFHLLTIDKGAGLGVLVDPYGVETLARVATH